MKSVIEVLGGHLNLEASGAYQAICRSQASNTATCPLFLILDAKLEPCNFLLLNATLARRSIPTLSYPPAPKP